MRIVFILFGLATSAFVGCLLAYWIVLDREPPIQLLGSKVMTTEVDTGGLLRVQRHVYRLKQCLTRTDRVFVDSQGARFTVTDENAAMLGPLGEDTFVTVVPVPQGMAPGGATYKTWTAFVCNPFHNFWPIVFEGPPVSFTVR